MFDICGDNRFEIIEKAKKDMLDATNIKTSPDEMKVLDSFLFRCWQMRWLDKYGSTPIVPGHDDQYNIAEMSYNNGYAKGYEDGKGYPRKWGHWIIRNRGNNSWAECSECLTCGSPHWKVCPVCETKMEVGNDD